MEKHIMALEASAEKMDACDQDLEERALELAIAETYKASGEKWKPWAHNARALRIGEIILLVDSDTVVPEVRSLITPTCWFSMAHAHTRSLLSMDRTA